MFFIIFAASLADGIVIQLLNGTYRFQIHKIHLPSSFLYHSQISNKPMDWFEANEACKNMGAGSLRLIQKKKTIWLSGKSRNFASKNGTSGWAWPTWEKKELGGLSPLVESRATQTGQKVNPMMLVVVRIGPWPNYNDSWVDQDCKFKIDKEFHKGDYKFYAVCESVKTFSIGILPHIIESSTKIDFPCR